MNLNNIKFNLNYMKTENMKLLDLQTGKYLELGERGFFYGGKTITYPPTKSFGIQDGNMEMILHIYADTEKDYDIKRLDETLCPLFEITLKSRTYGTKGNNQKLIGREVGHFDMRFNRVIEQTEPPLPLKEICEKVGAVVYGGRYVLLTKAYNVKAGDLWNSSKYYNVLLACINYKNNIHFKHNISGGSVPFFEFIRDDNNDNLIVRCSQNEDSIFLGNPFEEFAKKEQGLENKFDKLKQYFK